jgi:hypothetical protein
MRRILLAATSLLALAALTPAAASARVVVESPQPGSYSSNGPEISGWNWLRAHRATASWRFSAAAVQAARTGTVYLLFSPLVTNSANGGSGHTRSISVVISGHSSRPTRGSTVSRSVSLYNPFRPTLTENTNGVGYQTYGYTNVPSSVWRGAESITVSFEWRSGDHVAVNPKAVQLAYRAP